MMSVNTYNSGEANILSLEDIKLPASLRREDPIAVLGFPTRLENALRIQGDIFNVGQFCDTPREKLIKIRNIGPKAANYMIRVKKMLNEQFGSLFIVKPELTVKNEPEPNKSEYVYRPPLVERIPDNQLINKLLDRCGSERAKEIIAMRYGLQNGERQTLVEIGEHYGVTRERIRQIESKTLLRLKRPMAIIKQRLIQIIEDVIIKNGGIISAEKADIEIPKALGDINEDGSSILDLLTDLGWIQKCKIGDITIYSTTLSGVSLSELSNKIITVLKAEEIGADITSIIRQVRLFSKIRDTQFVPKNFILQYCRTDPRVDEIGGTPSNPEIKFRYYTTGGGFSKKGWVEMIKRVLEEEGMPLHFTEIAHKVNDLMGNSEAKIEVRRAHSLLIEDETFAHSGVLGTYGLTSWGFRKELLPELIVECMKKAGFPLHYKQIYNYVSKFKDTKPGNIHSCLEINKLFKRVDTSIYWLSDESGENGN